MLILASAAYPHRLIFWFFSNVISPHEQGSFDFSRTRLAFFRDLPDQLRCPSHHRGMAAISGFAEQCRKMNAIRLGGPFGLSVHGEKQLIGNIVLMDSSHFR